MGRPLDYRLLALISGALLCVPSARSQAIPNRSEASAHHTQGLLLYQSNDPTRAIREFELALEIDPQYAEAWNDLGVIQRKSGDLTRAIKSFEKAVEVRPTYEHALYNLALAYEAHNDL